LPLTPGFRLGPYEILSLLGAGGMGEVYRARDSKLDRYVAIKVLPESVAADPDRLGRFEREAKAIAALSHPNILAIHDFGTQEGVSYAVMELLEGETLRGRLVAGPIHQKQVVDYALQIAKGLSAAHEKGIVHRDLKPENLFVGKDGHVKILDFGLAKRETPVDPGEQTDAATASGHTEPGTVMGTVGYMSPEQVRGRPADRRSDIFSFGAVLYEMLTGRRAFRGDTAVETMNAILKEEPPGLAGSAPEVSPALERVVRHCLEKNPAERFQSARDIAFALGEASSGSAAGASESGPGRSIRSLVVLPFENRSGDPAQEFFSDGMTDALIADLAQIAALRVISRTSAMRFKGTHPALSQLARELNVDGVVEGSALRVGDRVRITVQLVDVASDRSLWAKSYERGLSDILALQSEVAHAIADEIRIQVTPEERARLRPKGAVNPAAHVAYLQGLFLWNRFTSESVTEAILRFEEALAFDPNYAVAYAGLADSYIMLANHHILPPREAYSLARKAAERGLSLDDSLAELHTSLGWIHRLFDWDWPATERECLQTAELNPGYAFGRSRYALFLSGMGRHEEAIAEAQRALDLDPLNLLIHTVVGDTLFYARRFDRSVAAYRKCLELDPTFGAAHTDLARSLEHVGRTDEAVEEFLRGAASPDGRPRPSTGLAILYARAGRRDDARATMEAVVALAQKQFVSPYGIASYYAVIGDNDRALDWLERAYAERDGTLVWLKVHPRLDGLRGESRLRDLLARMRLDS
jgi:serine/threonine protein kinase/tetratricopeptide (TPR) repeat protein